MRFAVLFFLLCILITACATSYISQVHLGMDLSEVSSIMGGVGELQTSLMNPNTGKAIEIYKYEFFDAVYYLGYYDKTLLLIDKVRGAYTLANFLSDVNMVIWQYEMTKP